MICLNPYFITLCYALAFPLGGASEVSQQCGNQYYIPSNYICYDSNFLCPILAAGATLRCGPDCYLPNQYSCANGRLVYPPISGNNTAGNGSSTRCQTGETSLHLSSPPYENYFYGDCHSTTQVVVTSPLPDSNLSLIGPRVIFAWPAGNSGIVTYFTPTSGINGTLGIRIQDSSSKSPLSPIFESASPNGNATIGITTQLQFNSSATLSLAILGSIRTIRDFTEGSSLLRPMIQDAVQYSTIDNGVEISRLWLDNVTTTTISFTSENGTVGVNNQTIMFQTGTYTLNASFNYPQLTQLSAEEVLSPASSGLITQLPEQSISLSFLSYTTKLTAGAWRFLTYFGRDSMIAALLLQPVLSVGEGGAIEAVLAGVLERVNNTDGSVCHEETIGDYATWLNLQNNITSTAPLCDYKMIDSDYYLPVLMDRYFLQGEGTSRATAFLGTTAEIFPSNSNLTYKQLAQINSNKIVTLATPFTAPNNQTKQNLMHLKPNEIVGEWRDSTYGIGGGRIPFDVNSALVPAALRSIASLSKGGILDFNATLINSYAQVWEDATLQFFQVTLDQTTARSRLENYSSTLAISGLSANSSTPSGNVTFNALALDGNNNLSQVAVMNTDECFRLFLLNTTNQEQLTSLLNSTAANIQRSFPAGLMTDVGLFVANPAYGGDPVYAQNFTQADYHGTVVWSWQLAMMARGLELQLSRCDPSTESPPEFCQTASVYDNVKSAYNALWDSIEANEEHLSTEVWSWRYENGRFEYVDLGVYSPTESDVVQLWSLTFLAVRRNEGLK